MTGRKRPADGDLTDDDWSFVSGLLVAVVGLILIGLDQTTDLRYPAQLAIAAIAGLGISLLIRFLRR